MQGILRQKSLLHAAKIFVRISRFLGEAKILFLLRKIATHFRAKNTALRAPVLSQLNPFHTQSLVINLITYLLTPCSRVLLEKLTGSAVSQEIPRILWNPKVHYRTHKCQPLLPILRQLHPVPTTLWKSILILSSHLRLGLPNGLVPSGFLTRTLCTALPSPMRHMPHPSHSSRFYHPHNIG